MSEFLHALGDPDSRFLLNALAAALLASLACGVVGSLVVVRRITYMAGAISHSILGGIGAAVYARHVLGWEWCTPTHGSLAAALISALVIGLVSLYAKEREDTVIGAFWAIGMAVGLLFFAMTPVYADPMSYIFGNILLIPGNELGVLLVLDLVVLVLVAVFYSRLMAVSFDEEFARLRGLSVEFMHLLLLGLTAITVVLLVNVVGIILLIALITLPAAVAGQFSRRLWQMMALGVVFCALFMSGGLAWSYEAGLPTGPVIILVAGGAYILATGGNWAWKRWRRAA
jgi:zinc transport system permease protein